ncbi:hypothetical protein HMPREF0539_0367 [Lacticaseibacillus rhamnosus LMS2-1]|uniref:Uncharacterized protein n=1 Tax=Lacticaseibacillus rhamnosus (strain LMS2-1) TaxID=525361 RepID=C2JTY3_LACRM|nr:hypothetical protein LRHK_3030 [Lacticaseibacillus rhamnosus ATCC 8530]EEN81545.1 hypothetical protein HMPREF0539_0367 [Lacticaseibacillus rhamnosus LMS2-1]
MAKDRPSRPRPLTLRSLTAPARAHKKSAEPSLSLSLEKAG